MRFISLSNGFIVFVKAIILSKPSAPEEFTICVISNWLDVLIMFQKPFLARFSFCVFRFKKNLRAFYFVHPTFRSKVNVISNQLRCKSIKGNTRCSSRFELFFPSLYGPMVWFTAVSSTYSTLTKKDCVWVCGNEYVEKRLWDRIEIHDVSALCSIVFHRAYSGNWSAYESVLPLPGFAFAFCEIIQQLCFVHSKCRGTPAIKCQIIVRFKMHPFQSENARAL